MSTDHPPPVPSGTPRSPSGDQRTLVGTQDSGGHLKFSLPDSLLWKGSPLLLVCVDYQYHSPLPSPSRRSTSQFENCVRFLVEIDDPLMSKDLQYRRDCGNKYNKQVHVIYRVT